MALISLFAFQQQSFAQSYPPAVSVDGIVLNGGGGTYSGGYYGNYTYNVTTDEGYWNYTDYGHWESQDWGYWDYSSGYLDGDGNWIVTPVWMPNYQNVWVLDPTWIPNWVDVPTTGTAFFSMWLNINTNSMGANVTLEISNNNTVQTASFYGDYDFASGIFAPDSPDPIANLPPTHAINTDGRPWAPVPPEPTSATFGPAAIWANGVVYSWTGAYLDGYNNRWIGDYYADASGNTVTMVGNSGGGADIAYGLSSGHYNGAVFNMDYPQFDVRAADSAGNVIYASAPAGAPPAIRVDGGTSLWKYIGDTSEGGSHTYVGVEAGQRLAIDPTTGSISMVGESNAGVYREGVTWMPKGTHDVRSVSLNGTLSQPATQPSFGPPAVWVCGTVWRYAGTWIAGQFIPGGDLGSAPDGGDHYLGDNTGQSIVINSAGVVNIVNLHYTATGTYAVGPDSTPKVFTVAGHSNIYPGDANGSYHKTVPNNGPPAMWVNGIIYAFVGSNEDPATPGSWVDTYSDGADDRFLVRATSVQGWTFEHNQIWSGSYNPPASGHPSDSGVFVADSGNGLHYDVRASGGITPLQPGGSPHAGHPAVVKVDGSPWPFAGSIGGDHSVDYYYGSASGQRLWIESTGDVGFCTDTTSPAPAGSATLAGTVFVFVTTGHDLRACDSDNRPIHPSGQPQWGPPSLWVEGVAWKYLGTVDDNTLQIHADYYGGCNIGQLVTVDSTRTVGGAYTGIYDGGVFVVPGADLRALDSTGGFLAPSTSPGSGHPDTLRIGGLHWQYLGSSGGVDYYASTQGGQRLSLASNGTVTYSDRPDNITGATGTYAGGTYTAVSGGVAFAGGTINGDLDILGNILSMGSLADNKNTAGLTISFNDKQNQTTGQYQSTVMFAGSRTETNWMWAKAAGTSGTGTAAMMSLDADNKLIIFNPADPTQPPIVLDPNGPSTFGKAIHIAPQGDLPMFDASAP